MSYSAGLFGEVIENTVFYLPLQFLGFYFWGKRTKGDGVVQMKKLTALQLIGALALGAGVSYAFGLFLSSLDGQVNPFIDAYTNVFTVFAALLMLKRYREYWLLYIGVKLAPAAK